MAYVVLSFTLVSTSAIVLSNGAGIEGVNPAVSIITLYSGVVTNVITNLSYDGTQEYAWLDNISVSVASGATSTHIVNFVSLFVNSGIRRCIIVGNDTTSGIGVRLAGGVITGFGPVFIQDTWVLHSQKDNIRIEENNPTVGACCFSLERVTVEHQADGYHGINVVGYGGFISCSIRDLHYENGKTVLSSTTAIKIDGAPILMDCIQLLSYPITNKKGIWITNKTANKNTRIHRLSNSNLISPVIQDDLLSGNIGGNQWVEDYLTSAYPNAHYLNSPVLVADPSNTDVLSFAKNNLSVYYNFCYNGNSLQWRYGTGGVTIVQYNTDGTAIFYQPIIFGSSGGARQSSGSGSPEGVVVAPIGSIYLRTDGGAGTTFFVKESGTGNTGWIGK